MQHSEQNSLKVRVKMASESVLSGDNTAIYSGLGLDMSPMSSSEGTPVMLDRSLPDFQETQLESPSVIIKMMTAALLPNDALVSPLHDDLICLTKVEKTLDANLTGIGQAEALNIIHDSSYLGGNIEADDERKPNLKDMGKENSKLREESKERKLKQNIKKQKPAAVVKADNDVPANFSDFDATEREEIGTLVGKKVVSSTSVNAADARFKEVGKFSDSGPSDAFNKKSEVDTKQVQVTQLPRHKVKDEFALASSDATAAEEGNLSKIRNKPEKVKNQIAVPNVNRGSDKRNDFGRIEDETNTFVKQHSVVKEAVKEEDFSPGYPKDSDGYRKGSGMQEKTSKEKEVGLVSAKDVKDDNKHVDVHQLKKHHVSGKIESSKQKSNIKATPHVQIRTSLEEPSSSLVKKKLKDRQIGKASSIEPSRVSLASSSGPEGEDVGRNISSRSKRGDIDLPKEMRKDSDVAVIEKPSKKGKEVSSREAVMGPSVRDAQPSVSKVKEQLSNKKTSFVNTGPKLEGSVAGSNLREKAPVGELPLPANDPLLPLEMDDWVQCEKCQKWRLLPFGMNPNSLAKEWICGMLTWLPGMNKCSVSEDETTLALRTLYLPSASGPALLPQNNQPAQLDGIAYPKASSGSQNAGLSNLVPSSDVLISRGKKKNIPKLEIDAAGQGGAQDLHRPIKKDLQHSGGITNPKNLKKLPLETASATKNAAGAGRPSKNPKKRTAEAEVSGVPKRMKNVHQQSTERSIVVGLLPPEAKDGSQNHDLDAFRISRDFIPESSECLPSKVKYRGRDEESGVSERKRKLKDQQQSVNGQRPLNNPLTGKSSSTERRKDTKTNTSNVEARESSADMGHHRIKGNGRKHNPDCASDNQHKGPRVGQNAVDPHHADRVSRKAADARKTSEKALDLGLSDNATTSSSSKVSTRVKAKASEVKCSPAGSISSSPMKACKSDPEKGSNKAAVVSYSETEQLSSRKRLKASVEGAGATQEVAPHNEEIKGRKSNLSRISGVMSDAAQEDNFSKKVSSGRRSSAHSVDSQQKREDLDCHDGKLDDTHHEGGTAASQGNTKNQMPNGLHLDGTSLDKQKLVATDMGGEKEQSIYAHYASDFEKGSGSNSARVDNGDEKLSRQVLDDHVSLRRPHHAACASKDMEASSSKKMDSFHNAAKTALKEAKDLKHSANRLKTAGSGLSTGIFFQAALKFLHGASLLEPGTAENGRIGEMKSSEVYSSTAKLCEYCAHEYEKCNDMASAALAYKCMEVAYMRVVYDNDVSASRDRMEVQMAVRAAPQVESPSSSASDIDNLNNQVAVDSVRDVHSMMDHRTHVISARNRPNVVRLLNFTHDINLAMEASRRSQSAFSVANPILSEAGNEEGISSIKRVLDFSFHDVDGLLHLVRLAMEALNS
ncbi:hypothetical protein RND81_09G227200 [Saponaria officinalis]